MSVEPLRRPARSRCPGCARPLSEDGVVVVCAGCGAGAVRSGGRAIEVVRFDGTVDAVDVPRCLAAGLEMHGAEGSAQLLEVHRLSLPYWWLDAGLIAAYPTAVDALRRLPLPSGETRPAALRSAPPIPADEVGGEPQRLALVPAYDVVYGRRGREYHVVIDGIDGRAYADHWPHGARARVDRRLAAVLALDAGMFVLAGYLAPDNLVRSIVFAAISYPIYRLTRWVVRWTER